MREDKIPDMYVLSIKGLIRTAENLRILYNKLSVEFYEKNRVWAAKHFFLSSLFTECLSHINTVLGALCVGQLSEVHFTKPFLKWKNLRSDRLNDWFWKLILLRKSVPSKLLIFKVTKHQPFWLLMNWGLVNGNSRRNSCSSLPSCDGLEEMSPVVLATTQLVALI